MKRYITFIIVLASILSIKANLIFNPTTKYRITCESKSYNGSILAGFEHGSIIPVLYSDYIEDAEDSFWYIKKNAEGSYSIQNAKTKEYIQFTTLRINDRIKGLLLTNKLNGDSTSWNIGSYDNALTITSVANPSKWFNLRLDGTNLMGCYDVSENPTPNESYSIYDEDGNQIIDENSDENLINPDNYGVDEGEYWEGAGLSQPYVFTTDTEDPILYTIKNVRSGEYIEEGTNGTYTQSLLKNTQFYFVKANEGIQIYSSNNNYASTASDNYNTSYVSFKTGISDKDYNNWKIEYYNNSNFGYSICSSTSSDSNSDFRERYWNDYGQTNIGFYGLDSGGSFIFSSSDPRHKAYLEEHGFDFDNIKEPTLNLASYISELSFDGKDPIYDNLNKVYMLTIPTSYMGEKDYIADVIFQTKKTEETYTLEIEDTKIEDNSTYTFSKVNGKKFYHLNLKNEKDSIIASDSLFCTFLPIVEITLGSCNGSSYTAGKVIVNEADKRSKPQQLYCKYKYRGATAQGLQKKSYNIKFTDELGEKKDYSFFGLRDDNSWILDAMGVDLARMRNRVSTDLWNSFSTPTYFAAEEKNCHNGTRGRFVEILMNGAYHGVYCMTEKIDRKQLKLKKIHLNTDETQSDTIRGCLYKSNSWGYAVFMGHNTDSEYYPGTKPNSYNNKSENWQSFEMKYPDLEDGEDIDWGPLYNNIYLVAQNSQDLFDDKIDRSFDLPVVRDYYLFIELMLATDNHGKNMYYSIYNKQESTKLSITPWDLDGTWGRNWYGNNYAQQADQDFDTYLWDHEHGQLTLYKRLRDSKTIDFEQDLKDRYQELRRTAFNPDSLCERFETYDNLFAQSGADEREKIRWNGANGFKIDIPNEIPYITEWIRKRIETLDDTYEYDPLVDIESPSESKNLVISCNGKSLFIKSTINTSVNIYNLYGQLIKNIKVHKGINTFKNLPTGMYIVKNKKVIINK